MVEFPSNKSSKLSREINKAVIEIGRDLKSSMGMVQSSMSTLQTGVHIFQQDRASSEHKQMLEWLSTTDFPTQQVDFISRREPGTGQWFLDSPKFNAWLKEPKSTLFCPGLPGAGKTMIAAATIDHLYREVHSNAVGVAFLYFNYKTGADQTATSLLSALLKQLVQNRPDVFEPVSVLYRKHRDGRANASLDEISSTLQGVLSKFLSVLVVIDALDECSNRDGTRTQILSSLRILQAKADLRLLCTSRFIPEVVEHFSLSPSVEVRASPTDVKKYVASQVFRLPKCVQRDAGLQQLVEDTIIDAVDGM
jgi:NACHT domain